MPTSTTSPAPATLNLPGFTPKRLYDNLLPPALYEEAIRRGEGLVTDHGAFNVVTTPHTGRSPLDKFIVEEPGSSSQIWWEKNGRLPETTFDRLQQLVEGHLATQEVFLQDLYGGADPAYRLSVRFVTPKAWNALFVRNMFIRPAAADLGSFRSEERRVGKECRL